MPAFICSHIKDPVLDDEGVKMVVEELPQVAERHDFLVCDLSKGQMTLEVLKTLPSELVTVFESKSVALDLSFNRMHCNSWEEIEPVLDQLLGKHIVHYLDLSNNSLPALETLKQDRRMSDKFKILVTG